MKDTIKSKFPYKIDELQFTGDFDKIIENVKKEYGYKVHYPMVFISSSEYETIIELTFTVDNINLFGEIRDHLESAIQSAATDQMK